jgi:lipopolysaccharide export system permease protein
MFESHRVLHRYVIREFLKIFALSLSSLMLIYIVVLFFQKMSLFNRHQAPFYLMFEYLLYKIPEATFQWTIPYAALLSTLLTLGTFSRHSEITAFKSGGISLYRITLPLIFIVLIISFLAFLGTDYLVPYTNQKTRHLLDVKVRKDPPKSVLKNFRIWYRSDHRIFNIQLLDPKEKALKGFTLYEFDDQFRCVQRIDANEVRWIDGKWRFYEGAIRDFDKSGSVQMTSFKETDFPLKEDWESFQKSAWDPDEMTYAELRAYVREIQTAGYDATRYLVALYSKLSYPLLNVIMVLIGIPFALKTGRSGGVALSIGVSVILGFIYGVVFYVFISFGKSGILPPILACWIPTFLFGLAGVFTLMSLRQ